MHRHADAGSKNLGHILVLLHFRAGIYIEAIFLLSNSQAYNLLLARKFLF